MHLVALHTYCKMMHGAYNVKSKMWIIQCQFPNSPWGKNSRLKYLKCLCDRSFYDVRTISLLTEDAEGMSFAVEYQNVMGCTLQALHRTYRTLQERYPSSSWLQKKHISIISPPFTITVGSPSLGCLLKLHNTFRKNSMKYQTQVKVQLTPSKHL